MVDADCAPVFGTSDGGGAPLASSSPEQMQVLLNMINTKQTTHERMAGMEWIIDTGHLVISLAL